MKVLLNLAELGVFRGGSEEGCQRRGRRRRLLLLPHYLLLQLGHHELGHRLVIAVCQGLTQERVVEHVERGRVEGGIIFLLHHHERLGGALHHDRVRVCRCRRRRGWWRPAHDDAPVLLRRQEGCDGVVGRQLLDAVVDVVGVLEQLVLVGEQAGERSHAVWGRISGGRRRIGGDRGCPLGGSRRVRYLR